MPARDPGEQAQQDAQVKALSDYPDSYTTDDGQYTYTGYRAQVIQHLKHEFGTEITTYPAHRGDGDPRGVTLETNSADWWPPGQGYSEQDNGGSKELNAMAEYCRANKESLGILFTIWQNRVDPYDGSVGPWVDYGKPASVYGNNEAHMNHTHITFSGVEPSGSLPDSAGDFAGDVVGGVTKPVTNAVDAAVDKVSGMGEAIATGVAKALLRFIRAVFCIGILWPIDFLSGYYWELLKMLAGEWAKWTEGVDLLAILKGDRVDVPKFPPIRQGDITSEENVNRIYFLAFVFITYILAFGRDRKNSTHLDNMFNVGEAANVNATRSKKGYDEESVITARASSTVEQKTQTRKVTGNGRDSDRSNDRGGGSGSGVPARTIGERNRQLREAPSTKPGRDSATGKFTSRKKGS